MRATQREWSERAIYWLSAALTSRPHPPQMSLLLSGMHAGYYQQQHEGRKKEHPPHGERRRTGNCAPRALEATDAPTAIGMPCLPAFPNLLSVLQSACIQAELEGADGTLTGLVPSALDLLQLAPRQSHTQCSLACLPAALIPRQMVNCSAAWRAMPHLH